MVDRRRNRYSSTAKKRMSKKHIKPCKPTIADNDRFMTELAKIKKRKMIEKVLSVIS